MKKSINLTAVILLSLILSVPVTGHTQELKGWYIGATVQPMKYWKYNHLEQNIQIDNFYKPVKLDWDKLNGIAYGVTADKNFGNRWGIKIELTYISQKTNFLGSNAFLDSNNTRYQILNSTGEGKFRNLKLPILATHRIPLSPNKDIQIIFREGIQFSMLVNYEVKTTYQIPRSFIDSPTIVVETPKEIRIINSQIAGNPPISNGGGNGWIYSRFNVGSVTCVGISGKVDDRFTGHRQFYGYAGLRFEYDFTNADNWNNNYGRYYLTGGQPPPVSTTKPPSHNIRAGLEFGLSYYLEKHK